MKTPGKFIYYIDKNGNQQHGRTYNNESFVNGKLVVHLLTYKGEHIKDVKGQNQKVLVDASKVIIKGFID